MAIMKQWIYLKKLLTIMEVKNRVHTMFNINFEGLFILSPQSIDGLNQITTPPKGNTYKRIFEDKQYN
ncbi:unnamed protein product [Paramecium octaurelia]|uniref:Uncharacterized protein n=1 Tax=Paramecium octaurelia TaxID=43137 RepID=A0A8S1YMY0_PAROT|nr:unnamed protein product [Paramecium octaurelia]